MSPLLEATGLVAGFGSHTVLHGVDIAVEEGEIAGIFGLNGAGKSVTLKVLAGLVPAWPGSITFDGTDMTKLSAEERVELGIGHVPQGRHVFANLTVEENLRLGAYVLRKRDRARYAGALDTSTTGSRSSPSAAHSSPGRCPAASRPLSRSRVR